MIGHLYFKKYEYHHNFTRGSANFYNSDQVSLSGHYQSFHPAVSVPHPMPAVTQQLLQHPWLPHSQHPQWHPATHVPDLVIHASIPLTTPHNSGSISPTPPYFSAQIPIGKRPKLCYSTQVPPKEAYIKEVEEACFQLPLGGWWTKIWP